MKIGDNPHVMEAVFAARKAALAMAEEKSKNTLAANASSSENSAPPAPIVTDHMRATGQTNELEDVSKSAIERIREIGMSAYAEEIKAQKIEEMKAELRKLLLGEMGISENELAKMPPKQRASIEKIIEDEIQKRLAAMSDIEDDDGKKRGILGHRTDQNPDMAELKSDVAIRNGEFGPGIGVLLALQEAETANGTNPKTEDGIREEGIRSAMNKDAPIWQNFNSDDE